MRADACEALPEEIDVTCPYRSHREVHGEFATAAQDERATAAAEALRPEASARGRATALGVDGQT